MSVARRYLRGNASTMERICYNLIHMKEPVETAELLAFSRTVDARSLSRAASELGVPRATISRRLMRLEQRLGVRLLRRTTRSLALTDAGQAFYRHARLVLDAVKHAQESVRRDDVIGGSLRVSAPPISSPSFRALICAFAEAHPGVQLQVDLSTRHVDLRRDGYDVALRASTELEPGLTARVLSRAPVIAVAAPAYLAAHGTPQKPRDLREHRCLLSFARGELPQTHWPLLSGGKLQVEAAFTTNDMPLLGEAALRGLGIALVPRMMIEDALLAGELVHVLPGVIGTESRIAIVYLERELLPPQVRAFVDAVVAWAPGNLGAPVRAPKPAKKRRARA
jgi:DNA-binding transcriptional LysR family regulator